MPSPGIVTLKTELAFPYTVEGGFPTQIALSGEFNTRLATAMHNGWTCATPTTPSQMEPNIITEFSAYVNTSGPYGTGWQHLLCLGRGIDQEIDAWVASWNSTSMIHTFIVTAGSIYNRIITCYPWNSNGTDAMAHAVADAFAAYFVQEVG